MRRLFFLLRRYRDRATNRLRTRIDETRIVCAQFILASNKRLLLLLTFARRGASDGCARYESLALVWWRLVDISALVRRLCPPNIRRHRYRRLAN